MVLILSVVIAVGFGVGLQPGEDHRRLAALDGSSPPVIDSTAAPVASPDACGEALAWVADAGLRLPAGVDYRCPSTQFAHHGTACWHGPVCRGTGFIAINLELIGNRGPNYLRFVVAHEVCHILDFKTKGTSTEAGADACAAAHGAPR